MKVKSLGEVRDLIGSPEFRDWWDGFQEERSAEARAAERFDELLAQSTLMDFRAELAQKNAIDTLYRAGAAEDTAAKLIADATELENRSFEVVAAYEEQRFKVSEIWYRLGAAEKAMEDARERLEAARAAVQRIGDDRERRREAEARVSAIETELRKAERDHRQIHDDYEREARGKLRLWEEVERMWSGSAELNLVVAEKQAEASKVRKRAERLFSEAEERKRRAQALRGEADEQSRSKTEHADRLAQLLKEARERFGCAAGTEFLYWRQRDDQQGAFCVSLIDDSDDYNIEVNALGTYRVEKQRGVRFLEPAREGAGTHESDQRFEAYFLQDRKGRVRPRITTGGVSAGEE